MASVTAPRAAIPEQHTPPALRISIGPPPSRPWTIEANPGTGRSAWVVPVASMPMSFGVMPRPCRAARTASAAISSLRMVVLPDRSMA